MDSIIFDVDGTLWDTTHVVADAWNEVVRSETSLDLSITPQKLKTLSAKPCRTSQRSFFRKSQKKISCG